MLFRMQPCITIKLISRQSLIEMSYGLVILDLRPGCLAGNLIIADKHEQHVMVADYNTLVLSLKCFEQHSNHEYVVDDN